MKAVLPPVGLAADRISRDQFNNEEKGQTMSTTSTNVSAFEHTLQQTNEWLDTLVAELGHGDRHQAYRILRAVLLALRDRLTVEEATDLGAQLPMLIRGFYYEQWTPSKTPTRERRLEEFLDRVAENTQEGVDGSPEETAKAGFRVLDKHITSGEAEDVKSNLPEDIRTLWS